MGVLALGLALLFVGGQRHFATAPDPLLGNMLAAGSALAWAFTVTGYRWLARRGGADHGPIAAAAACGNPIVFLVCLPGALPLAARSEEDTSELQSHHDLVCRLLLAKQKKWEDHTSDLA